MHAKADNQFTSRRKSFMSLGKRNFCLGFWPSQNVMLCALKIRIQNAIDSSIEPPKHLPMCFVRNS